MPILYPKGRLAARRHPVYTPEYVMSIQPRHKKPETAMDWTGYWTVTAMRWSFDTVTGYRKDRFMSSSRWLIRILFLETVAGARPRRGGGVAVCGGVAPGRLVALDAWQVLGAMMRCTVVFCTGAARKYACKGVV
jgi:hypothetical protein